VTREKQRWLDESRNVTGLFRLLVAVCVLLVLADLLFDKHGHFDFENIFGFHAFFGFAVFIFIVLAGKYLRKFLMRKEDYYDR